MYSQDLAISCTYVDASCKQPLLTFKDQQDDDDDLYSLQIQSWSNSNPLIPGSNVIPKCSTIILLSDYKLKHNRFGLYSTECSGHPKSEDSLDEMSGSAGLYYIDIPQAPNVARSYTNYDALYTWGV